MKRSTAFWLALTTFIVHAIGASMIQPSSPGFQAALRFQPTFLSSLWSFTAGIIIVALIWYAYCHPDKS